MNITNIIVKRIAIEPGLFAVIATNVGGHFIVSFSTSLEFCQPSNSVTGRRFTALLYGDNIDFSGTNQLIFVGNTTDAYGTEILNFSSTGEQTTTRYFTSLTDVFAMFTPLDPSKKVGAVEVKETFPINVSENGGDYAEIHLSVQDQNGMYATSFIGTGKIQDAYSRFGAEDIGKTFIITSPAPISGIYKVQDVLLDLSSSVRDSNTIILSNISGSTISWAGSYSNIIWKLINTSYGDSGFANGLITLEIFGSGGIPFLLRNCWYEVDFPTYLVIPWEITPENLYIGSDMFGENQACAVIDEVRILDELSIDTRRGETTPSSGRSITTDVISIKEFSKTAQTLGLFHFDNNVDNEADFLSTFSNSFRQSENSVNSNFGQSGVFNVKKSLQIDNKSVFKNKAGTIEFWVSPILDVANDPTKRYYVDISSEQIVNVTASSRSTVILPIRARSINSITLANGDNTINYFIGGQLKSDGQEIKLGQPLPSNNRDVVVTYVPITSQGDRFSIFKNEVGFLVLLVTATGVDYQISAPIYWKKNTWHRVFVGWDLNNTDNQDRLILIVDGLEAGTIRYGTGLRYGTGVLYGQPTVWGSARVGTMVARNILADINMNDIFNTIHIGADFTEQFSALARIDNMRFSSQLRDITYLGGSGPGQLIGRDLLFTSNVETAQPVIEDAFTRLLLDFNTEQTSVENLATIRDEATGIFDFFVSVIDTFDLAGTDLIKSLIVKLMNRIKPAHTRAFVDFIK
jgi:hypothetical protein